MNITLLSVTTIKALHLFLLKIAPRVKKYISKASQGRREHFSLTNSTCPVNQSPEFESIKTIRLIGYSHLKAAIIRYWASSTLKWSKNNRFILGFKFNDFITWHFILGSSEPFQIRVNVPSFRCEMQSWVSPMRSQFATKTQSFAGSQ